jgi:hypothetical protein
VDLIVQTVRSVPEVKECTSTEPLAPPVGHAQRFHRELASTVCIAFL